VCYTSVGVRRQAAALALALGIVVGAPEAGARKPKRKPPPPPAAVPRSDARAAAALGKAYAAYRAGDFAAARAHVPATVAHKAYALYIAARSAALGGAPPAALPQFVALAGMGGSRFHDIAALRAADCLWDLGRRDEARAAYEKLVPPPVAPRPSTGDI